VSLAAIVASMSLMISMAIMVTSFRDALDLWLERILPADVYVRAAAAGDTSYMTPEDQTRIAALPGVRRAEFPASGTFFSTRLGRGSCCSRGTRPGDPAGDLR
jgi:putative ABC transport system permease protein